MTVTRRRRASRRTRTIGGLAAALTLALVGAACGEADGDGGGITIGDGDGDGKGGAEAVDFQPTAAFVAEAAERSAAEPYRMDLAMSFAGSDSVPMATAMVDGDRSQMSLDMAEMLTVISQGMGSVGGAVPEFEGVDMTMEMITLPDTLYLRAPMFAALSDIGGGADAGVPPALVDLGDGWGSIDVAALGDALPADVQNAITGGQAFDPTVYLELVSDAEGVEELGTRDIDGERVTGLSAEVSFGDLLEAAGTDPSAFGELGPNEATDDLYDQMTGMTTPVEVWVDEAGFVRQIAYTLDMSELLDALGEGSSPLGGDMSFGYTMDLYDYGDESISIEAPADATDITESFASLVE
jgi:hypothetical protein